MAKFDGISINIGIDIKPTYISDSFNVRLKGCKNDATFMSDLAKINGFEISALLTDADATFKNVEGSIKKAQEQLNSNGVLLISYSGHGSQIRDPFLVEDDGLNEYLVLSDKLMLDNTLFELLTHFDKTQRIIFIADSCNSGTIIDRVIKEFRAIFRKIDSDLKKEGSKINVSNSVKGVLNLMGFPTRNLKNEVWASDIQKINSFLDDSKLENSIRSVIKTEPKDFFEEDTISSAYRIVPENSIKKEAKEEVKKQKVEVAAKTDSSNDIREEIVASVLTLSACQDWQLAREGTGNAIDNKIHGLFTEHLMNVLHEIGRISISSNGSINLNGLGETLNYLQLHQAIWDELKNTEQNPNYQKLGTPNAAFEMQNCFTI